MSDEYEYGPWTPRPLGKIGLPKDTLIDVMLRARIGYAHTPNVAPARDWDWEYCETGADIIAYRIATPKPKRELVVGKWYRSRSGSWHKLIGLEGEKPWFSMHGANHKAMRWGVTDVQCLDWSTPPRDEAPE